MGRADTAARGRTVALIGGDGSGKSSVARRLVAASQGRATYLYMGPSLSSATHRLPTSRLVLAIRRRRHGASASTDTLASRQRPSSPARFLARSVLQYSEVVHREVRVRWRLRRGVDVVFDRHILFEIWETPEPETVVGRLRNRYASLLRATCRRPDLTVLLRADPDVMLERKGETDTAYLERRNREWAEMASVDPTMVVVDANRDLDVVVAEVAAIVSARRHHPAGERAPRRATVRRLRSGRAHPTDGPVP